MSRLPEIFEDDRDRLSSGRVYAAYCVVSALICWSAGVAFPSVAVHAQAGMSAFLTAAVWFYGEGKGIERLGSALGSKMGPKEVGHDRDPVT